VSLARDCGNIVFECDDCNDVLDTGTESFREAIENMHAEGWTAHRIDDGVWEHKCRSCSS
jgi:hypothetical protein